MWNMHWKNSFQAVSKPKKSEPKITGRCKERLLSQNNIGRKKEKEKFWVGTKQPTWKAYFGWADI